MNKTKRQLIEKALDKALESGILIKPGPAAFDWTFGNPGSCSGTGALLLYLNLVDGREPGDIAKKGWNDAICSYLEVNTWWYRRFYCGFELDRQVYTLTDNSNNAKFWTVNNKGKKFFYINDDVSRVARKIRAKYEVAP